MRTTRVACSFLAALAAPRAADACSLVGPEDHVVDPAHADDVTPPGAVTVAEPTIERYEDGGCERRECGEYGSVGLAVEGTDDRASPGQLGFELTLVAGTLPQDMRLPAGPVRPWSGLIYLHFDVEGDVEFELEVRAVDLNGNRGAATRVRIADDRGGGCSLAGSGSPALGAALIPLAALIATRRRRR